MTAQSVFYSIFEKISSSERICDIKHLMTSPEGNSSLCFSRISMLPRGAAEGNIEIRGKQNELFPEGPVIK